MRLLLIFFSKLVLTGIVTFIAACGGSSNSPTSANSQPTTAQEVLDNSISQGIVGIFAYIDKGDATPLSIAAGVQNIEASQTADPDTLFKIASISKMFIRVASTMLIHDGTIQADDTLATWLPDLAPRIENSESITIKNLLQHRSGVPDFDSQTGFSWNESHTDIDETLEFALDLPADFEPDAIGEYSNSNYLLMGKILDAALGYSHHIYIQDNILTPLNLNDTYNVYADADPNLIARGYWNDTDYTEQDYVIPGGSMVSTVKDIATFIRSLATGDLIDTETRSLYNFLFGEYAHSGWLPGYYSIARYHPHINAVIVQFVNETGGDSEEISDATYDELVRITEN